MKPRLSVIIIAKNEASRLAATLESVAFADEIVVLDSGSTDGTLELARQFTDKVFVASDWRGFGIQKNRALSYATGDWVLSIDADERVGDELRLQILAAIAAPVADVYEMPRRATPAGGRTTTRDCSGAARSRSVTTWCTNDCNSRPRLDD